MRRIQFIKLSLPIRIAIALGTVYLIWGSTYLAIRFAIESMPPYLMAGTRFIFAGLVVYILMRAKGIPAPQKSHWIGATLVGGLLLLGGNGSVVWAEQRVPSGIAALIVATVPLWIVLLDWLWHGGIRPGLRVVSGIALGFTGIFLLISQGDFTSLGNVDLLGAGALILASLSWAIGSLYSRHAHLPPSPFMAIAMQMLAGGVLLVLAGLAGGELARVDISAISLRSWLSWAYLIVFGALVGFTCYIWLLRVAPAARVATYAYVNPVIAVFLGWALADEVVTLQTLFASAIIITAVFLITSQKIKKAEPIAESEPEPLSDPQTCPAENKVC